jgi:signal transduction histidine kinase
MAQPPDDVPHPSRPDDERAFVTHASELAVHWGRHWMLGITAVALLWWPTDLWVFGDRPDVQATFAWIRGLGIALHLLCYAALRASPWVRTRSLVLLPLYGALAITLPAFALSHLGGPSSGWFGYLYVALLPSAFFPLPLLARALATAFAGLTLALAYFGSHPEHLSDPMAASALSYLLFDVALVVGLGAVMHGVVRRAFFQSLALSRASHALGDLNRLLDARVQEQALALQHLAGGVVQARDVERSRIARELHDELGQELTAARMALSLTRRRHMRDDPEVLGPKLAELERLLNRTASSTRDLINRLRPRALDELGLGPAVEALVADLRAGTGLALTLTLPDGDALAAVPPDPATAVYRFVQEALTNVLRHASASAATVTLHLDQALTATVEDDGVGLDESAISPSSHGIAGMRERALALGGSLTIAPAQAFPRTDGRTAGRPGTRVTLRLPR